MSSTASSTIAQLVTKYTKDNVINELNPNNIIIFKRYVNVCFCIVPDNNIDNILNVFINVDNKLKFTTEKKKINYISWI